MSLTAAQLAKLGQNRKLNPPSFFNAATGESETIDQDTEDALILVGSAVKQKAAQYLDLLLDANPSKSDYDVITARAADKQVTNLANAILELEPVIANFSGFKDNLLGAGSQEDLYVQGMRPLLTALLRGMGSIRNRVDSQKFTKKLDSYLAAKFASELTDAERKEWRSWKRVLLSYP